jgi:hypothetical protein
MKTYEQTTIAKLIRPTRSIAHLPSLEHSFLAMPLYVHILCRGEHPSWRLVAGSSGVNKPQMVVLLYYVRTISCAASLHKHPGGLLQQLALGFYITYATIL